MVIKKEKRLTIDLNSVNFTSKKKTTGAQASFLIPIDFQLDGVNMKIRICDEFSAQFYRENIIIAFKHKYPFKYCSVEPSSLYAAILHCFVFIYLFINIYLLSILQSLMNRCMHAANSQRSIQFTPYTNRFTYLSITIFIMQSIYLSIYQATT